MRFLSFLLFLIFPLGMSATCALLDDEPGWTLEVRVAYYQPSAKKVRKVYSSGWLDYQVLTSKRFSNFFEVWGGVSWANKHGHTRSYDEDWRDHTRLSIVPLSLGVRGIYPLFCSIEFYVGAGVCYSFLHVRNHCRDDYSFYGVSRSPFKRDIHRSDFGAIVQTGFHYTLCEDVFLDFFADYFSQQFDFPSKDSRAHRYVFKNHLNCSGFKLGAGLGVYF